MITPSEMLKATVDTFITIGYVILAIWAVFVLISIDSDIDGNLDSIEVRATPTEQVVQPTEATQTLPAELMK